MIKPNSLGKTVIVGGDGRQNEMVRYLSSLGVDCLRVLTADEAEQDAIRNAECIILPLPITKDGIHIFGAEGKLRLDRLCALLDPRQKIFAGMVSAAVRHTFAENGLTCTDYFKDEALSIYNAALTAQGLLKVTLDHTKQSLTRRVLITGYGRVGKQTARLFKACHAKVTVAVRSEKSKAEAECDGMDVIFYSELKSLIFIYDIIINTVPAQVIDKALVRCVRNDALLLEAASAPYGIDPAAAAFYGKKLIPCPSLPGKYTEVSAGRILADTVIRLRSGEGNTW